MPQTSLTQKLIFWDEALMVAMVNKHCFEASDRTLKDIMRSSKPFGVLKLTENMRLRVGNNNGEPKETKAFADWILSIGNGEVGEDQEGEAEVEIPNDILIIDTIGDPIDVIINVIYPDVVANLSTPGYFEDRPILAPTNNVVNKINERMMKLIPTKERVYLSSDSVSPCEVVSQY
ncbi:ATP-dependent DNA helicase PIF1-like protein [Tanacetum coccineum]